MYVWPQNRVLLTKPSLVIPILTYGFLGVESVTTTAFEAADRTALRLPSRYVAYLITLLYFLSALGEAHSVSWSNASLPELRDRSIERTAGLPSSHAVIVLAAQSQGHTKWAAFFTGCMIFFCLSAANTALYISSRTLYGLTRSMAIRDSKWYFKWLSIFGTTTPVSRVPGWALLVSAVAFCWLPFLHLRQGLSSQDVCPRQNTLW
jgi:yeast amino acid transporter